MTGVQTCALPICIRKKTGNPDWGKIEETPELEMTPKQKKDLANIIELSKDIEKSAPKEKGRYITALGEEAPFKIIKKKGSEIEIEFTKSGAGYMKGDSITVDEGDSQIYLKRNAA